MTTKGITSPGSGIINWDVPLNANFAKIEKAFGDAVNITATSGTYALSATEMGNMALRCVGALTANLTIQIASGTAGQWVVVNSTTDASGGPWKLLIASLAGGVPIEVERGTTRSIYSDGTATGAMLADTTLVSTANIKDAAVTLAKLGPDAITPPSLQTQATANNAFAGGLVLRNNGSGSAGVAFDASIRGANVGGMQVVDVGSFGAQVRLLANAIGGADGDRRFTAIQINADGNQSSAHVGAPATLLPQFACRAWVNFNGGDGTKRGDGNIATVTRVAPGDYAVNFATAMPDANYCVTVTAGGNGLAALGNAYVGWASNMTTTGFRVSVSDNNSDTNSDPANVMVTVFR